MGNSEGLKRPLIGMKEGGASGEGEFWGAPWPVVLRQLQHCRVADIVLRDLASGPRPEVFSVKSWQSWE